MSRLVLLATEGVSTNVVYHALEREFTSVEVIIENHVPRYQHLKRRVKKLGILTVIGQILFMLLIERPQRKASARRIEQITKQFSLQIIPLAGKVTRVVSVNSEEARSLLKQLNPDLVIINGTRILAKETLACIAAPIINMHSGITPAYRGVHGGYWALAEGHPELVGTTVHFVDKGIDTGKIIRQVTVQATEADSFVTYPVLQLGVGVPALVESARAILAGTVTLQNPISALPSRLYSHPTLWRYLVNRITRKVK